MTNKKLIMRIGMLWYDKDATDVDKLIAGAAAYYFAKYGKVPERCHVHPDMFDKKEIITETGKMRIVADKTIDLNHVWVGIVS